MARRLWSISSRVGLRRPWRGERDGKLCELPGLLGWGGGTRPAASGRLCPRLRLCQSACDRLPTRMTQSAVTSQTDSLESSSSGSRSGSDLQIAELC